MIRKKRSSRSLLTGITAVLLAVVSTVRANAETPREELVHAYVLMKLADHDYGGHRILAMREVEAVGKDLGLVLKGDGSGEEKQRKSDEQLVEARRMIVHAREKLEDRDRQRAAARLEQAVKEIDASLAFEAHAAAPHLQPVHVETPREEVVHAYNLLEMANHDYGRHRLVAMREIETIGKDLGFSLKRETSGNEQQGKSDEQLVEARRLLTHAREKLEAGDRERAATHLETAIQEITAALKVK